MSRIPCFRRPSRVLALVLLALSVTATHAQPAADAGLRGAFAAAARGQTVPAHMSGHPAYGWVEFTALRRNLVTLPASQADAFMQRYRGQAVAEVFREGWLRALANRGEWQGVRAAWSPSITNTALRCIELDARAKTGALDAQWTRDVQAIWRSSGASLPDTCDAPLQTLAQRGELGDALRWERFELAAAEVGVVVETGTTTQQDAEQ